MIRNSLLITMTIITTILFTGCSSHKQPLACFKGSPSCFTQQHIKPENSICTSCRVII